CGDTGGGIVTIPANFDPKQIDFGMVAVGTTANQTSTLRNVGTNNVTIKDVQFNPSSDAFAARLSDGGTLRGAPIPKSGQIQVTVLFAPTLEQDYSTSMVVSIDRGAVSLPIRAFGRKVAPPMPMVNPATIAFADTELGRDVSQTIVVSNTGELD